MEEVAKDVELFQKKLQKYTKLNDKKKLLFYLSKLKSLPIKVSHLEATGVGKSVNALRHNEGDVGEKARHLVGKWKKMVTEEENQQDNRRDSYKYTSSVSTPHKPLEKTPDCSDDEGEKLQIEEVAETSPQLIEEEYDPKVTVLAASNSLSTNKYALPASCSDDDAEEEKYDPITSNTDFLSVGTKSANYEPTQIGNSQKEAELDVSNSSTSSHKSRSSSHKSKKHKSHSKEKESSSKDKSKHKSKKSSSKSKEKSSRKDKKKDKERSSSKHSKDDKKSSELSTSDILDKRLGNHSSDETSNEIKHGRDKDSLVNGKRKVPDAVVDKSNDNHSQPSSSKKDKSKHDSEHKSKKRKVEDVDVGFGAALLNLSGSPKKKKSKSKSKEKSENKSSSCKENIIEHNSPVYEASTSQSSLDLPSLDPNYKPLPRLPLPDLDLNINGDCSPYDNYDDDMNEPAALTQEQTFGMYAKNKSRRQIYTGKITGTTELPSLMTLCIRSLQENISALEYTGGVPYDILKPVIERATPDQLFTLENYNPYLLEDTNGLWEGHCKKKFKNSKTEDMETYRDLYIRLTDERTQKLENLTKNLQNKFVTRPDPRRSTVLAFVDSVAGPPKSVARAQAKFGTGVPTGAPAKTKAAEIVARKNAMHNVQRAMNSSANARTAPAKKTKAPLMAKTMQFYKKTYRR